MKLRIELFIISLLVFICFETSVLAQTPQDEAKRIQEIEKQLDDFSKKHKELKESVEISVNTDLRELVVQLKSI